jgi:hypothetical protein
MNSSWYVLALWFCLREKKCHLSISRQSASHDVKQMLGMWKALGNKLGYK